MPPCRRTALWPSLSLAARSANPLQHPHRVSLHQGLDINRFTKSPGEEQRESVMSYVACSMNGQDYYLEGTRTKGTMKFWHAHLYYRNRKTWVQRKGHITLAWRPGTV